MLDLGNANEFKRMYYADHKTHNEMVLEYMERYGSITPLEALIAIGSFRLASRIWDIKSKGYNVGREIAEEGYAIYYLV